MTHTRRWLIPPPLTREAEAALAAFPPILRQILFNRGYAAYDEARTFLEAKPGFDTDPFQMTGMGEAVERIRYALTQGEAIAIYGDYDVDGVTATALLVTALRAFNGNPSTGSGQVVREYIPNRFDEGYGLNNEALTALANDGVRLVITVDCGIRSPDEARHARDLGLDLVISDHHEPSGALPDALAVVNPKQDGDAYPEKYLAGVGIAYKIVEALASLPSFAGLLNLADLLDLVALGTVADLAPLTGENRSLVRGGLRQLRQTARQGLFSLANVAEIPIAKIGATHIGYMLGPRLNASGRLESALASYQLLTTTDVFQAGQLAQQLDVQNRQRQQLTREIQTQAEALAFDGQDDPLLLFAVHPEFNHGVVGLAASRLTETYYRPSIVGHYGEETTRCSCRSIPEFHITHALDECADLLVRHGGHAAAAGFTVRNENLDELVARLRSIATRELDGRDLRHTFVADAEVKLKDLSFDLLKSLDLLEPTGYGNPSPVFVTRGIKVQSSRPVGADGRHLKLALTDGRITFDSIGFRLGHLQPDLPPRVDVLFVLEVNEYNGNTRLQLNLKDIKPAGVAD